jgi:hypothetical protein
MIKTPTIGAGRVLWMSLDGYSRRTGSAKVKPQRLFRLLGVRQANVEAVAVSNGMIKVTLYRAIEIEHVRAADRERARHAMIAEGLIKERQRDAVGTGPNGIEGPARRIEDKRSA